MKNTVRNNHQDTQNPVVSKIGLWLVNDVFDEKNGVTSDFAKNHGVSAIAVKNSDYSSKIEHSVKAFCRTLTGFKLIT